MTTPPGESSSSAPKTPRRGFQWRRWNNVIHRDIGYLTVGLTLVYAISGVAVNHMHQWNPNHKFELVEETFEPFEPTDRDTMTRQLVEILELPSMPQNAFREAPERIQLFYTGWSVEADVSKGWARLERPKERFILRDANFLHLNHPKGIWTWVADLYAVALGFLAITGMFVLKGKKGLSGRGKWLVGIGVLIPIAFLVALKYL